MTPPTLPGDLSPTLLRRCSPVLGRATEDRGTVYGVDEEHAWVVHHASDRRGGLGGLPKSGFALDLSDATGRAHATWWLAESGAMLPIDAARRSLWVHEAGERQWTLWAPLDDCAEVFGPYEDDASRRVPALAHLDPLDDTRLPDGSRWVDAEALRIVALHVAGRSA